MGLQKTVAWSLVSAVTLLAVAVRVEEPLFRATLSVLAVTPLLYLAVSAAVQTKRIADRRAYLNLRKVTDEFLMNVRNLNRLKIISQTDSELGEADEMIDEIVKQMHDLVERIRVVAGQSGPTTSAEQPASDGKREAEPQLRQAEPTKPA